MSQSFPVPCQQQLIADLMLWAVCEAACRTLCCPGKAGEEMRNLSGMQCLWQSCSALSFQVLLSARLVHGTGRSNSCSEGDGEIVFIKKKKVEKEVK